MKFFIFFFSFVIIFLIFQYAGMEWFSGLDAIRTLFSLTVAIAVAGAGMGVADALKPDDPEDEEV